MERKNTPFGLGGGERGSLWRRIRPVRPIAYAQTDTRPRRSNERLSVDGAEVELIGLECARSAALQYPSK